MEQLPVFDLADFLAGPAGTSPPPGSSVEAQCGALAACLAEAGALVVRDPRASAADNRRFLDIMEAYFGQEDAAKRRQARPSLHYQVGATPDGVETPRSAVDPELRAAMAAAAPPHCPALPSGADPKWRYMWRVGPRPAITRFQVPPTSYSHNATPFPCHLLPRLPLSSLPANRRAAVLQELNAEPVVPDGFPDWEVVMDTWGAKMIAAVEAVAEMAALGFGLQRTAFTSLMKQGPHLLAPTGSDLARPGAPVGLAPLGTVFAGYHYDLNFLTIHGASRFPGLHIWLRNGRRLAVAVPAGCLLVQAGKQTRVLTCNKRLALVISRGYGCPLLAPPQLEWLTGGEVLAGWHEVVMTDAGRAAAVAAAAAGRSLWRVSSTVFGHIASDTLLRPLGHFAAAPGAAHYPPVLAGDFVEAELAAINLKGEPAAAAAPPSATVPTCTMATVTAAADKAPVVKDDSGRCPNNGGGYRAAAAAASILTEANRAF
eukprot:SM000002S05525  [mRNA]  locus=s2:598392:600662:+ [translate_table: standard]